ncbi:putative 6K2 protein, partial [Yam mosaic virus]
SENEMSKYLGLKGRWNKQLLTKDILVMIAVFGGGVWMAYEYLVKSMETVKHQ